MSGCQAAHTSQPGRGAGEREGGGAYLVAAQRHFATAASAAAYVAVMANVANAIGELGLKANVTGGIQLDAGLLLLLGALSDLHLQCDNFVLLATAKRDGGGGSQSVLHLLPAAATHRIISFCFSSSCFCRMSTFSICMRSCGVRCDRSGISSMAGGGEVMSSANPRMTQKALAATATLSLCFKLILLIYSRQFGYAHSYL